MKTIIRTLFPVVILLLSMPADSYDRVPNDIRFDHLSTEDGLSQDTVFSILQDRKGFMWFGAQDGLNRYDGYEFRQYKNNPKDENSLSGNFISALYEDASGFLWISTRYNGLNRYNPETDSLPTNETIPTKNPKTQT